MKKYHLMPILTLMILVSATFSSCEAIGQIFKAGMWVGIIIVVIIIAVIFWIIGKVRNRN